MDFSKVFGEEYITNLVDFLREFSYLFTVSNTQYLKRNVLEEIPEEWINFYKNQCPESQIPESYEYFLNTRKSLKINFEKVDEFTDTELDSKAFKKVNLKKIYEIQNLAEVISSICSRKIEVLINFGSGLGYLCNQLVLKNRDFKVLGLEAKEELVETATERLLEYYPENADNIIYATHFITEDSDSFIQSQVKQFGKLQGKLAIVGLHCCADLTITAINLFFSMENVKKLVIMPCCYHKMKPKNEENTDFYNIPLSSKLKKIMMSEETSFINRPFLRLGCQQTTSRWDSCPEKRFQDAKNMFERAILECLLEDDETVEKVGKSKDYTNHKLAFEEMSTKYNIKDRDTGASKDWMPEHRLKFNHLRKKYPDGEELSDFLTFLQSKLQALCENLVLIDRLLYMNEVAQNLHMNVKLSVKKLPNDKLTPRCFIMIAEKCKI